jgi:hypothetical protein
VAGVEGLVDQKSIPPLSWKGRRRRRRQNTRTHHPLRRVPETCSLPDSAVHNGKWHDGLSVDISILDVCMDGSPRLFIPYKFLVVIGGIKLQSVLGRIFSFCNNIKGVFRAGLCTSVEMVTRIGFLLFKMVALSPFTHWKLSSVDVVIVSIIMDVI